MKISRKQFLKQAMVAVVGAVTLPASSMASERNVSSSDDSKEFALMLEQRKKARSRFRRIIMNNDGNDSSLNVNKPVSQGMFLSKRTLALPQTQVDSVFYCDGVNNVYSHLSDLTERPAEESKRRLIDYLEESGTDTLTVMTDFCHQHGIEIFWSMRMNDNHDSTKEYDKISEFKKKHPELLVGVKGVKQPMMYNKWSPFDYNKEAVRRLAIDICEDVAKRYDIDGIELDFFRHPAFFKEQFQGIPITQKQCDLMTGMVRAIRKVCDDNARRRGRTLLLAIRVPDSLAFSKAIGLDWERWLAEDLVDLVIGADYLKFEPWINFAAIGRKYKIPVYACLEQRRLTSTGGDAERETTIELWRGEAYTAWSAGVSGIYTFNRFDPNDQIFKELGDPSLLAGLPRIKGESYCGKEDSGYLDPDYWVKGGRQFLNKPSSNKK